MSQLVSFEIDVPDTLDSLRLPPGVDQRLQFLLDRQQEDELTPLERQEAEGLVDLAELLSLLRLRAQRLAG